MQKDPLDAELPESVFVYTHVIRASELYTYGFRPNPFHNRSRGLEDFRIDLSPLYPDNAAEDGPIHDGALHDAISFSPDDEQEENEQEDDDRPMDEMPAGELPADEQSDDEPQDQEDG